VTAQPDPVPRATRYPLNLPVRFRPEGDDRWGYGMTLNISHTGLLLRADRDVGVDRQVEIEVVLPGDEDASARVVSRGTVRRAAPGGGERNQALAVAFEGCELVRVPRRLDG
jgi:hypothetical protein